MTPAPRLVVVREVAPGCSVRVEVDTYPANLLEALPAGVHALVRETLADCVERLVDLLTPPH